MSKRTKTLLLIVMVLGLASLITYNYSMAKYVSNSFWNYYLSTKGFYFSSDLLDTTKITNINNNWEYDSTYIETISVEGQTFKCRPLRVGITTISITDKDGIEIIKNIIIKEQQ